jgi:predicted aldo/keto reductase-like oxidoreductase
MTDFRRLPNGRLVSTIGIGAVHWHEIGQDDTWRIIQTLAEHGINLLDFAMAYDTPFPVLGDALAGKREQFVYQLHLGLTFNDGQYELTRDIEKVSKAFESQMASLKTSYANVGYIHCVDDADDFNEVFSSGTFKYAMNLKRNGKIHHLGFATHTIDIAEKFIGG